MACRSVRTVAGPPPRNSNVHDYRVAPPAYRYVNPAGKVAGEEPEPTTEQPAEAWRVPRLLLYGLVNLAFVAAFGLWWFVRSRRRRPRQAP